MPRFTRNDAFTSTVRTLYHHIEKNADGSPLRARITGKLKEWRRPHSPQWQLPMKHGFKGAFYINDTTADEWFTVEDEARLFHLGVTIHKVEAMQVWQVSVATARLPDTFSSFGEALAYAVRHHLPVAAPAFLKPWAIVEVQLDGRVVIGELVSMPTHDQTIMVRLVPNDPNSLTEVPIHTILRTAARYKWVHYAIVKGNFGFPTDMLRYDSCEPVNFTIELDGSTKPKGDWPADSLCIVAACSTTRSRSPFTPDRWASFSWSCKTYRIEKIGS